MITIATHDLPTPVQEKLKSLPTEFHCTEISKLSAENLADFQIIFTSLKVAEKMKTQLSTTSGLLIVYTPDIDSLSPLFQVAKQLNAFSIVSNADLADLATIFKGAHQAAIDKRKSAFQKGKTVGFISLKGGVGKSFLSYNLASQLASYVHQSLLLIDAGVPLGSGRGLLNISSDNSWQVLRPLLKTGKDLTSTRLQSQVVKTGYDYQLLSSPNNLHESPLSSAELRHLMTAARQNYSLTLVDLPSAISSETPAFTELFDLALMVFTPDANSIVQVLELWKNMEHKENCLFVCNMVEPVMDKALLSAVSEKLKPAKLFMIDNDQEAVKTHQRSFKLFADEGLLLTEQLKNLAKEVFFKVSTN